ncbi:FMN-dependent NADH-azoreductase [Aquibacillus rhizosphaerae]|uniref:FMN dependent NADH:quinone oxidoreductase n=1 Tax=Aquibacillus rhizosphaerae TaxID=3051431 RepID=A0ABT7L009_9BACI|nr:FMN-dependent NADH-azoreductase [Aquibacillus sp. LR5S19]MDL4839072.1 FMN-dependent NADH-azoreductase [Aquibacillus sp. LR5S19]
MNILVVKANNRPSAQSVTSKMYETFMEAVREVESLSVTTYDIFAEDMPYLGQDLFDAFDNLHAGEELTDIQKRILTAKQKAKDALIAADLVVFAFPMWNQTIPAKLQTFIDYVYEAGFTFKFDETGNMVQLMTGKKAILLNARGGIYSTPEMAKIDMAINYMRNVVSGVFGLEILDEVIIEGHNAMPDQADQIIEEGLHKVKEVAQNIITQTVVMK